MMMRIHLDEGAQDLVGSNVVIDGEHVGPLTGVETELEIGRGWHILELRHRLRPTRALHFNSRINREVDVHIRPVAGMDALDRAWFEAIAEDSDGKTVLGTQRPDSQRAGASVGG